MMTFRLVLAGLCVAALSVSAGASARQGTDPSAGPSAVDLSRLDAFARE